MKAGAVWPLAIAAVLGVTVAANIGLLWQANAPGSDDIEPDYYRRALAWDSTQTAHTRSVALGWRTDARFVRRERGLGVEVALADSLGQPLSGAEVAVIGVHNLDSHRPQVWTLREAAPGRYDTGVQLPHAGRWELRVSAKRGTEQYLAVQHAEAPEPVRP